MKAMLSQRYLLLQLVRRDLAARYKDSLLGLVWLLLTPVLMLAVYSFVFGVVFEARWGLDSQERAVPFALLLYSGLILHALMAEILPQSVSIIRAHPNYVKKVVFPTAFLPLKATLTALSLFFVQWVLLAIASMVLGFYPTLHWLWLPLVVLPYTLLLLGAAWLLAALGVFIPDLKHIIGLLMTVLLFLSPVFYAAEALPPLWQSLIMLNPLSFVVETMRAAMFYEQAPERAGLALYYVLAFGMFALGAFCFSRLKPAFADVL